MKRLSTTKDVILYALPHIKGRVLDLGAGMAKYKEIIKNNASDYVTCDAKKNENINVVCDINYLAFQPESFDVVVSTQVLEHVDDPFAVAREIEKVLKIGGNAVITAPFMFPFHADPKDNFRFSREGLEEVFRSSGFKIIDSGTYGGFLMVISEMIHFSWFNPYKHKSGSTFPVIEKIIKYLDKIFHSKIIYANAFIVAKKL